MTTDKLEALIERLRAKEQRFPAQGGGGISSDGTSTSYITDDGYRLVNPDGPEAAQAISTLLERERVLTEALSAARVPAALICGASFLTSADMEQAREALRLIDAALSSPLQGGRP